MFYRLAVAALVTLGASRLVAAENARPLGRSSESARQSREFLFTYSARVAGLEPGTLVRIWVPVPPSNRDQVVTVAKWSLPGLARVGKEPKYGNKVLYVEASADEQGTIPLALIYRVRRNAVQTDVQRSCEKEEAEIPAPEFFLGPDSNVPVGGAPLNLLADRNLPNDQLELGRALFDVVDEHMRYDKTGEGWGHGDALWAYESGFGNCTDFQSLFISLARSNGLPAKFEIGFRLPQDRGQGAIDGYCCWAKIKPEGHDWVPVSVSEASKHPALRDYYFGNLSEDRVLFSVGRDLTLIPPQDGPPLNFFVYPYTEVDGKPYPEKKVDRWFAYQDVKGTAKPTDGIRR